MSFVSWSRAVTETTVPVVLSHCPELKALQRKYGAKSMTGDAQNPEEAAGDGESHGCGGGLLLVHRGLSPRSVAQ